MSDVFSWITKPGDVKTLKTNSFDQAVLSSKGNKNGRTFYTNQTENKKEAHNFIKLVLPFKWERFSNTLP